ncbi:MAG: cyclopropane-fatty-acyl-phospholipid synthase family protein [Acidiferrobacterales bacterium]|jgi:cyclopropane-fatty-acyl-phospholipid synthase|nr:cyclopropane-fatty-acyl-phospholipid synthase family protein [Acidiferrobacterales bacterium]
MSMQKQTSVDKSQPSATDSAKDTARVTGKGPGRPQRPRLFSSRVTWLDRWIARKLLQVAGDPPISLALWDGVAVKQPPEAPVAKLRYWERSALLKTIANDELYWGDLYSNGQVEVEGDLTEFIEAMYKSTEAHGHGGWIRHLLWWLGNRRILNTQPKAKENIYHHYDIGNDFYKLWLDKEEMQYTCAYYPDPNISLEQAQVAKLHHVCRKLQLKPGDTVVEAGCGWGGLARFMARNYGVNVKAYNISREQVEHARKVAEEEGLSDQVEYVLDDYRNITGEYDVFVSVGMLEHVGARHYPVLGQVINRCLKPEGRGLIHTIGRNKARPMNAWIERRIFPGAYPPSLKEMMDIFEPGGLSVLDVENLRMHYARTLYDWRTRYEENIDEITELMDESFVRAWRLYLAGSEAAFTTGQLQLFQVVFARTDNNQLPWSRAHLYSDKASVRAIHHEKKDG